jgi:hypothetical protein
MENNIQRFLAQNSSAIYSYGTNDIGTNVSSVQTVYKDIVLNVAELAHRQDPVSRHVPQQFAQSLQSQYQLYVRQQWKHLTVADSELVVNVVPVCCTSHDAS